MEPGSLNFCKEHDCFASLECLPCSSKWSCISFNSLYFGITVPAVQALYVECSECLRLNYLINVLLFLFSRIRNTDLEDAVFSPRTTSGKTILQFRFGRCEVQRPITGGVSSKEALLFCNHIISPYYLRFFFCVIDYLPRVEIRSSN